MIYICIINNHFTVDHSIGQFSFGNRRKVALDSKEIEEDFV